MVVQVIKIRSLFYAKGTDTWHRKTLGIARHLASQDPWHRKTLGIPRPLASQDPWHPKTLGIPGPLASQDPWQGFQEIFSEIFKNLLEILFTAVWGHMSFQVRIWSKCFLTPFMGAWKWSLDCYKNEKKQFKFDYNPKNNLKDKSFIKKTLVFNSKIQTFESWIALI